MLDQPLIYGIPSKKQTYYQPVADCTYWPVLCSFKNLNIIHMSSKSTSLVALEEIHQVVLDIIRDNMALLVKSDKYGAINEYDTTPNLF